MICKKCGTIVEPILDYDEFGYRNVCFICGGQVELDKKLRPIKIITDKVKSHARGFAR